jgi:hypothetical protein
MHDAVEWRRALIERLHQQIAFPVAVEIARINIGDGAGPGQAQVVFFPALL